MYDEINIDAKKYLIPIIHEKCMEKYKGKEDILERCYAELNLLYKNNMLFIIEYLYKYKLCNKEVKYYFNGSFNNLLLLYLLDLGNVDPLKYNLSYELFGIKTLEIDIANGISLDFLNYLEHKCEDIKIVLKKYKKIYDEYLESDNYYILPTNALPDDMELRFNEDGLLETYDTNGFYEDMYLTIRVKEKSLIYDFEKIGIENAIDNTYEGNLQKILKPKSFDDYVKIKCLAHSTHCWKENQEYLVKDGKLDIKNIISNREDIYDYLAEHKVPKYYIKEIIDLVRKGSFNNSLGNFYKEILLKYNCSKDFIGILEKILYLTNRGEGISKCLYFLDKSNYLLMDENAQ